MFTVMSYRFEVKGVASLSVVFSLLLFLGQPPGSQHNDTGDVALTQSMSLSGHFTSCGIFLCLIQAPTF